MLVGLGVVFGVVVPRSVRNSEPTVCERQQGDDGQTDGKVKEEPTKGQWLPLEKDMIS